MSLRTRPLRLASRAKTRSIRRRLRRLYLEHLETRSLLSGSPWKLPDFAALDSHSYAPDSVLVSFRDTANVGMPRLGMRLGESLGSGSLYEVRLEGIGVEAALEALAQYSDINYAEPNWILTKQVLSNDTHYGSLWGMHGDELSPTNAFGSQAAEVWDSASPAPIGSSTVYVGIIDEGIDYNHPDLAANIWTNPFDPLGDANGDGNNDDDGNGFADDIHGWDFANNDNTIYDGSASNLLIDEHGTHVAGTIGAVGGNAQGVAGVNWNVQMISGKFLGPNGGSTLNAIKAIDYFTNLKTRHGLNIVALNNSWGGGGFSQAMQDAITRAAQQNILFVAAAGNGGSDQVGDNNDAVASYPSNYNTAATAGYDNVIAVAAINSTGGLASFSNYGANTVDLGAPGVSVLSTTPGGRYLSYSGTSMATPHVTGAVALYAANYPGASAQAIKNAILDGASITPTPALATKTLTGGRLNVAAAFGLDADLIGPHVTSSSPSGGVLGPISSIRVTFSEAIGNDISGAVSFAADDVASFTYTDSIGVTTPLTVQTVAVVAGADNRQFDITFPSQNAHGDYRLTIGPDIVDRSGNQLDQNRDGVAGSDQYTATFTIGSEISSPDVPAPLGGMWTVTASYLTIDQDVTIGDLDIKVNITHPSVGDLIVHLHDPSGKQVILSNRRGGTGDNFQNTRFDDEAAVAIAAGAAPYNGSYRPDQLLSQYDGKNLRGTWTLYVENWGSVTGGTLNAWSMFVKKASAAPLATNDSYATTEDVALVVPASGVLANDSDAEADPLSAVLSAGPTNGSLTLNADGSFTYTPRSNFSGADTFTYRANDGTTNSNLATVTIAVAAAPDAPLAASDSYSVESGKTLVVAAPGVMANDSDPDGNALSAVVASDPANGTVTLAADGSFSYTPFSATFVGTDSFTYRVTDGGLESNLATVTITVAPTTKFFVVNDGSPDRTYEYGLSGGAVENYTIASGNTAPRGIASTAAGTTVWTIDANRTVYVYNTSGGLLGSWTAGSLNQPQGITVHGNDVWIVDAGNDRVYRYINSAGRRSGSQTASSNFRLASGNSNPKDLVTDGATIYVVNDSTTDRVYRYTPSGSSAGNWSISTSGVAAPTGITLDPASPSHFWIVDSGTDRVYQYDNATSRTSGSQTASTSFALAVGNTNPQGIADPPQGAGSSEPTVHSAFDRAKFVAGWTVDKGAAETRTKLHRPNRTAPKLTPTAAMAVVPFEVLKEEEGFEKRFKKAESENNEFSSDQIDAALLAFLQESATTG